MVAKDKEDWLRDMEELEKLDVLSDIRDLNEEELWIKEECLKNIREREFLAAMDLKQKTRCRWAVEGDENSTFFHRLINNRKKKKGIPGLSIGDNIKRLSVEEVNAISKRFSAKEIKDTVFECGADKAPGPDGFNFNFLKHFWKFFEEDFRDILAHFHETGSIDRGCSTSFITLVPKVNDPIHLKDYRSINLIGVISKVISKILANRFKKVIGKVVSESQSAFLRDRYILDSPLILS
ncbi:uncharacterized protein LOC110932035 [Helianthus annuus]|uniref:uncharacterized protein LOC110932035 n=1 Tax=Helianthus annuus TaxID=4232 RepID=UPI000B8F5836|nr:uncharacterized protein LOC110932035 [Helianthus annuus]